MQKQDDDGEGAKLGVSDSEEDVARDLPAGEVLEHGNHHAHRKGLRDQIEHPHLSPFSLPKSTR
jgi:hypothetical protein